jgi:hypothetical protein
MSDAVDPKLQLLIEEWKGNVALYIDQDKRGSERIRVFLAVHGGLLVLFGAFWSKAPYVLSTTAGWLICATAVILTAITWFMSKRAHAFILLRKTQAILVEKSIGSILGGNQECRTSKTVPTTFRREHVAFLTDEKAGEWKSLREEVRALGEFASAPFERTGDWKRSLGHFRWLFWVHVVICAFWILLAATLTIVAGLSCLN